MMPVDGRETDIGHQALRVFYSFEHPCNNDFACGQLISTPTHSRTRKTSCSIACLPSPGSKTARMLLVRSVSGAGAPQPSESRTFSQATSSRKLISAPSSRCCTASTSRCTFSASPCFPCAERDKPSWVLVFGVPRCSDDLQLRMVCPELPRGPSAANGPEDLMLRMLCPEFLLRHRKTLAGYLFRLLVLRPMIQRDCWRSSACCNALPPGSSCAAST